MKRARCASGLFGLVALILSAGPVVAQNYPEVRRAQPADEPPVARALPVDQPPVPRPRDSHAPPAEIPRARDSDAAPAETESPDRRQLDYANALFLRKLYDLAVPEYEKYLDQYPVARGRASVYFFLGECHRALNRPGAARKSFQKVLDDYGESEIAGPAAYSLAETALSLSILWKQKKARSTRRWPIKRRAYCKRAAPCRKPENSGPLRRLGCAACSTNPVNTRSCWPIIKKSRRSFQRRRGPR